MPKMPGNILISLEDFSRIKPVIREENPFLLQQIFRRGLHGTTLHASFQTVS